MPVLAFARSLAQAKGNTAWRAPVYTIDARIWANRLFSKPRRVLIAREP